MEALVYFDPALADAARYRRKRAGQPCATRTATSFSATARQTVSPSSEQGPAMTVRRLGSWSMGLRLRALFPSLRAFAFQIQRRRDERREERMRLVGLGLELRVKLHSVNWQALVLKAHDYSTLRGVTLACARCHNQIIGYGLSYHRE